MGEGMFLPARSVHLCDPGRKNIGAYGEEEGGFNYGAKGGERGARGYVYEFARLD